MMKFFNRDTIPTMSRIFVFIMTLSACDQEDQSGEFYTRWDIDGACNSKMPRVDDRYDTEGHVVDVCDYVVDDGWVWVTYAAEWCSSSRKQASAVRQLTGSVNSNDVTVFTVLTSGSDPFVAARSSDAKIWAQTHRLPVSLVLYDSEAGGRVLPQHMLLGPDGKTWYRYIGYLDAEQMRHLLQDFMSGNRQPNVRDLE